MSDHLYTYAHNGYTASYRKKWFNPVFRNLLEAGIWAWMCDTAAWKETKVRFNGKLITLNRGQLVTSLRFISEGFSVGEQVTRTFVRNIQNDGMVNIHTNKHGMIITICNYEKYQSLDCDANTPTNTRPTHSQHTANTKKEEDNNIRIKEIVIGQDSQDESVTEPETKNNPKEKKKKSTRGTRLSSKWELPVEWGKWAESEGLTVNEVIRECDKFKDYWIAKSGANATKADWEATWRNWVRNYRERYAK